MKITKGPLLVLLILWAFGCAPPQERHPAVGPRATVKHAPLLPADTLDKKIGLLEDRLRDEDLSERDKEIASTLLVTYRSLKKVSSGDTTDEQYRKVIRKLFQGLSLLDKNFTLKKKTRARDYLTPMMNFTNKRREILDSYLRADYRGVINRSKEVKSVFGPDSLTPEIGLVLALSLAKEGMLKEAINTGEAIVNELEATPDLTVLRAGIAEWKLRSGQEEGALSIYEDLRNVLDKREAAIQSLHKKILAAKPPVTTAPGVTATEEAPGRTADTQTGQLFQTVNRLIQEQKFDKARELLSFKRSELLLEASPAREIETIDKGLKDLDLAEEEHLQEKISILSRDYRKRETMELAMKLLEEEKFEDAISRLDSLDSEQKESPAARRLKALAVEMLINHERNRAAKIFLAAKKTHDPTKKQEYLLSSYNILKALVDKYPSSPLILKVKSHIKVVREELDKLAKGTS